MDMIAWRQWQNEAYETLLLEYASGCLDEALALAVSAHLALRPEARHYIASYERIGGSLLMEFCAPSPMKKNALENVFQKIEAAQNSQKPCAGKECEGLEDYIPSCLRSHIRAVTWRPFSEGLHALCVETSCHKSRAHVVKAPPGASFAITAGRPYSLALVLSGLFRDSDDIAYGRGEILVLEPESVKPLKADTNEGAAFYLIQPDRLGALKNLLFRFFR
jgi:predicted ChrR family anti-sigma factor